MLRHVAAFGIIALTLVSVLPACSSTANVSDVYASLDEDGSRRRTAFTTDTAVIYCMAQYGVGRKDATIEVTVRRTTDEGVTVVGNADFHPEVTKDKPGLFPFKIPRFAPDDTGQLKEDDEAAYNVGLYRCDVTLDGVEKGFVDFNVSYPPCPTAQILPNTRCEGFYPLDQECPVNGNAGSREPTCSCAKAGWSCPK